MSANSLPKAIFIDGIDGSGKSSLAKQISNALLASGRLVTEVSVDDFRRHIDWSSFDAPESETYYTHYYDFPDLQTCVQAYFTGAAAVTIDSYVDESSPLHKRELPLAGRLLVIEGVFLRRIDTSQSSIHVYVDTPAPVARQRIISRDTQKGRSVQEVTRRIESRYFPSQEKYHDVFQPRQSADIVIDNSGTALTIAVKRLPEQESWFQPILSSLLEDKP